MVFAFVPTSLTDL